MDGAQVGVLKETDQIGLAGLLQGSDGSGLEPQVSLEVLGNFPDEPLEGKLADEKLGRLLVTPDLPQGDCAGPVSVGLLDSAGGRGRFPRRLSSQLFPRGLASGRLTCGLLSTSHLATEYIVSVGQTLNSHCSLFIPDSTVPGYFCIDFLVTIM